MVQHMLYTLVAAPLLVVGDPGVDVARSLAAPPSGAAVWHGS